MGKHFPIGLGTARLRVRGPEDTQGFEASVELVCHAIQSGVDYIDSSYTYAGGMAQPVLKEAFRRAGAVATTLKVMTGHDKTRDAALRRAEMQLKALGLDRAEYFLCWTIKSFEEFKAVTKKGGVYEAALRLRDQGVIKSISFSTHAPGPDTVKMLQSGMFDKMTISYSLLGGVSVQPVLDKALEYGIGAIVMNPLGGGVVPKNRGFFDYAVLPGDSCAVQSALRYCFSHPAVETVLIGAENAAQLDEAIGAVKGSDAHRSARTARVNAATKGLGGFCTGCRYCAHCPAGIPTADIMQARNTLLFAGANPYNRTDHALIKNIDLFKSLYYDFGFRIGESVLDKSNPCTACGKCNRVCTQSLDVQHAIEDTYRRAKQRCFTLPGVKQRFEELFSGAKRVGIMPCGGYAGSMLGLYKRLYGTFPFEIAVFDNNPKNWGSEFFGAIVQNPASIPEAKLALLLVSNYIHGQAVYESVKQYESGGLKIKKVYAENSVPWFF